MFKVPHVFYLHIEKYDSLRRVVEAVETRYKVTHIQLKLCIFVENIFVHIRLRDRINSGSFEAMRKGVIICPLQIKGQQLKLNPFYSANLVLVLEHSFTHSTFSVTKMYH